MDIPLVGVDRIEPPYDTKASLRPDAAGSIRLRVPRPGRLAALREQFALFQVNPVKTNRPGAGPSVLYSMNSKSSSIYSTSVFGEMLILHRGKGNRLPLVSTHQLMTAFRGAVMAFFKPEPAPEFISGHAPGSTDANPRRSEQPHLAFVPLADVGHDHAHGHIMGAAALVPRSLSANETDLCASAVANIERLQMAFAGAWDVEPVLASNASWNLRSETWIGPARRWSTVTPFVFDKFPKDPYGEEAQEIVALACERISLPRPLTVSAVAVSPHLGVPHATDRETVRWHSHAIVCFAEPLWGPLTIGAGRYYGYGFCRPLGGS